MKCCSINICGLSDKSRPLVNKYVHDENIDVLMVQETMSVNQDNISLTSMKMIADDNKAANRGAALYVNKKSTITKLKDINQISKNIDSSWGLGVINNKRYILGSIYVKLGYTNAIAEVIKMLDKAYTLMKHHKAVAVILSGDFNAKHTAWGNHCSDSYGKKLFENLDKTRYSILTSKDPTFLCKNGSAYGSSHIDLTIVTNNMVEKLDSCMTNDTVELWSGAPNRGHVPLLTYFNTNTCITNIEAIEKINMDKINWQIWSNDIEDKLQQSENYLDTINNPETLNEFLTRTIQKITCEHGEKKIITSHSKPYWTQELTILCDRMKEARKFYQRRNTDINEQKLKEAKEQFDEARKKECEKFILSKTENLNNIQKLQFWKEFNKLFRKKGEQTVEPLIDEDNHILTSVQDQEQLLFATFFQGKHLNGIDFDQQFYEEVNSLYDKILTTENTDEDSSILDISDHITVKEIKEGIKSYSKGTKSNDKDDFNPKMFKYLGERAIRCIQKVANQCLDQGRWVWSRAEVIFLRKSGKDSYSNPGSYRPISITSYIGKLIEKIIAKRIQRYLTLIGLHDPDQEGFMEGRNTIRYLNRLVSSIRSNIQKKLTSICLFIDFEKAFDSVWKRGLIVKMHQLGIQGKLLHLINDFLMSRTVTININGVIGEIKNCSDFGVPQGSALSPILFRIFVMDLASELANKENTSVLKFADDGTIHITGTTTPLCLEILKNTLNIVHTWSKKWRMVINCQPDKTEIICFCTAENNKKLIPTTFKLGDATIQLVSKTKVLGLILDENLDFEDHSKYVYKKMCHIWVNICKYSNRHWGFNITTMRTIINTLLIPTLMYAGHIWINHHNIKEINSLYYKIIKSAVGAVFNIRQSFAEVILGLPPIQVVNEVNKVKHLLKINMTQIPEDRLRELLKFQLKENQIPSTIQSARQVFKFLYWKLQNYPKSITEDDETIIRNHSLEELFSINPASCKYTKDMMRKYTEHLWRASLQNELQLDGYNIIPDPKCSMIPIPPGTRRDEEVMILSMFYPNNTLNSFLHSTNAEKFPDPLCNCGESYQTAHHILFHCKNTDPILKQNNLEILKKIVGATEAPIESSLVLLKASKNVVFIESISKVIKHQMQYINKDIHL